jgi:hypothetical protein
LFVIAKEFKSLLVKDFESLRVREERDKYIILIQPTLNKEISYSDPSNDLELIKF